MRPVIRETRLQVDKENCKKQISEISLYFFKIIDSKDTPRFQQ